MAKVSENINICPVQVLALQGAEIALGYALYSTYPADPLEMSPSLRGSNPYPCGSLTYRVLFISTVLYFLSNIKSSFLGNIFLKDENYA